MVDESKEALLVGAGNAISQSENILAEAGQNSNFTEEEKGKLVSHKEILQHLLAEGADDQNAIRQAVDSLEKTTAEAKAKADEKSVTDSEQNSPN